MKSFQLISFVTSVTSIVKGLPTAKEASAAVLARRCQTESYGDNGGTTYLSGDCTGYTFSGTNVVDIDNLNVTRKRDCTTSTSGDTTYTNGDCSGDTFDGKVVTTSASNNTTGQTKRAENNFPWTVQPPECQSLFNGWANWCNVRFVNAAGVVHHLYFAANNQYRLLASAVSPPRYPAPKMFLI